jgi:aldose 1-epimerase
MKPTLRITNVTSEMKAYELIFSNGLYFRVLNYGISLTDWGMTRSESWILKHSKDETYLENKNYLGCIIGPYAGRIKNAEFSLNEKQVTLDKNDGNHCLHGGNLGLSRVYWHVDYEIFDDHVMFTFTYEMNISKKVINYPGEGLYKVILRVTENKEISFEYETDLIEKSFISLCHHIYFKTEDLQDRLQISHDGYLQLDTEKLPTGIIMKDFKKWDMTLKKWFDVLKTKNGLDHSFILKEKSLGNMDTPVILYQTSNYSLKISTDCPYMVVYSGGYLDKPFSGIAFEAQEPPDGPNQVESLRKKFFLKKYKRKTSYQITEG